MLPVPESLPAGWAWTPLSDLLTTIETGKSFKCDERPPAPDEVGVVKVSAVSWGEYREQESKTCMDAERVNPALLVQRGDFLFSRANTIKLVGACVIAKKVCLRVMLSDKILRFHFASEDFKPWVLYLRAANRAGCKSKRWHPATSNPCATSGKRVSGKSWCRCHPLPNRRASLRDWRKCSRISMTQWPSCRQRRRSSRNTANRC